MPAQARAWLIGMFGPALQAVGVAWDLLEHGVLARGELSHITMEHLISGPSHLIMLAGFLVSVVCIPIALQVASTHPEDLERPTDGRYDLHGAGPAHPGTVE